ncbi:bifunctional diaminohydroxyphosphoribosylaminopyrimidine deaminase/5-amino-6-(5-phosphoribosylamino)uracil reductase RibD [Marinitoga aeolica]|uniref:Riboflavin biosynthesis protein RibD n=1 Tax=Marinitoga aeolica TaxID=2809031 RepID=A0ABY8PR48_9BACT|nr:bifunctional diaminohydroxyphosphoribosylaminopyrimidine deaminase/5-amino-6-(5-phosphoribosylamino)uracil reductase RibD [Marinitoga aeolica]WGS65081.1 bifunctional diaminohydroxyphosphoribosylaminopyrimidine deaminase/5-amino-6-(5-phosphoribosylamino)uracil reductase RibD [Marinitoga aeolica]
MNHEYYMKIAINEAKKGIGKVNPNPLVGAVIVKNGKIISKGYHEYYGGRHAEIVAIENAKNKGIDIKNSTMYVTLEPCSHYGKTPPCAHRLVKEGFKEVYIGMLDPNPLVNGKGKKILEDASIKVEYGILEDKIKELNEIFITYISKKRPFIALKFAMTLDGYIATKDYDSKWISNEKSRKLVHKFRNYYSSILIGANTLIIDNPKLTCRIKNGRNPIRIILDKNGLFENKNLNIFNEEGKNIIFTEKNIIDIPKNTEIIRETDIFEIINILYNKGIDSILVEGGASILSLFLESKIVDKMHVFYAPKILGNGISPFNNITIDSIRNSINFKPIKNMKIDDNIYWELKPCLQE